MTTRLEEKQKKHEAFKKGRRTKIKLSDIKKMGLDLVKENNLWTFTVDGVEFKNTKKNDLLRDLYTVKGYEVE